MEGVVPIQGGEGSIESGPTKAQEHPDCPTNQPQTLPNGTVTEETCNTDRAEDGDSDDSLTDGLSTNDVYRLIPKRKPTNTHKKQREDRPKEEYSTITESLPRPLTPICTPPSASLPPAPPRGNGHKGQGGEKRLPSSAKSQQGYPGKEKRLSTRSQQSFKADAAQIKQVAGDDCCVHCVLSCLFCEILSLCSALSRCLACQTGCCEALCCSGGGGTSESMVCCCCDEDGCTALWECGIVEDCCESADCLEICLECCSICFPV